MLGPPKKCTEVCGGFMSAPLGQVGACFLTTVGVATLMAWDANVTQVSVVLEVRVLHAELAGVQTLSACELREDGKVKMEGSGRIKLLYYSGGPCW